MSKDYKIIRMGRGGTIYARVPDGIETGDLYMGSKKFHAEGVSEWHARIATLEAENKAYDLRMDNDVKTIARLEARMLKLAKDGTQ